jgi:hypothetical protein
MSGLPEMGPTQEDGQDHSTSRDIEPVPAARRGKTSSVNQLQEGHQRSFKQVRVSMQVDRGHLRTMRLLPFAAAAAEAGADRD